MTDANAARVAYRIAFVEANGYTFCEVCGRTERPGLTTSVHHIRYISRHPKHPNIHDPRNLLLVCCDCHDAFHAGRLKEKVAELEAERGLPELFYETKPILFTQPTST
jgi:predicted HNH restriction endonuclease